MAHSTPYSGAFRGVELGGGYADSGGAAEVAYRTSTVIHLAGLRAGYRWTGGESDTHQMRVALTAHPLFLFLVASDDWGAVLASLYLTTGTGLWLDPDARFGWDWGAGVDLPLSSLDGPSSWWLGAEYTRGCTVGGGPYEGRTLNVVGLRLGWRAHGL